jgi:hypothetical protein
MEDHCQNESPEVDLCVIGRESKPLNRHERTEMHFLAVPFSHMEQNTPPNRFLL